MISMGLIFHYSFYTLKQICT